MTGTPSVIAVVGPTAVGKTRLAEDLALALGGEVVSADSMQVYRGMDIGTAKPSPAERRVPYHCVDVAEPGSGYSAALFQLDARAAIADIASRDRMPIVAGGTGLYVRAALDEMQFPAGDTASPARAELEALAARIGPHALHARLAEADPASAALIHPNNVRRTIRALEMADEGVSYAEQAAGFSARRSVYETTFLGLTMDRSELYRRIDARVDAMLVAGLLGEVESLLAAGFRDALTAAQAIGYKELVPLLEARRAADAAIPAHELDTAADAIRQATRRYAKRQLTWFRADQRVRWVDVTGTSPDTVLARALSLLESGAPAPWPDARAD